MSEHTEPSADYEDAAAVAGALSTTVDTPATEWAAAVVDNDGDAAPTLTLYDWQAGEPVSAHVLSRRPLYGAPFDRCGTRAGTVTPVATLYAVRGEWTDPDGMPVVIWPDGEAFTPADWQRPYPPDDLDVEAVPWVDASGQPAVMLCGLPRTLTAPWRRVGATP